MLYPADIRPLTGLRFVAAFWLLLYFFWDRFDLGPRDTIGIVHAGNYGVDLFFILSGFVLAHVYGPHVEAKSFSWRSFIWARMARIYPLHLVCLAAMIAIWAAGSLIGASFKASAFVVAQIPYHLALIHAWGLVASDGWNFPSWSISAEWFAYLTFPISFGIAALFVKRPLIGVALMVIVFVTFVAWMGQSNIELMDMTWQGGIVRIVPSFGMGIALWLFGRNLTLPKGVAGLGVAISSVWVAMAATWGWPSYWIWPGLAGLVFFLAETSKTNQTPLLASGIWVYLGEISFAAYMVHLPIDIALYQIIDRVMGEPTGTLALIIGIVGILASLVAAALAHALVEKPARNWLRANMPSFMARKPEA
jgi:peptidoglycan/LPS O-acetylase OafA/YrhL